MAESKIIITKDLMDKVIDELTEYRAIGTVEELKKSVKEEDVLKFYYIESEDKYVVGERVGTRYYAEVGKTGLCFYMSRFLPWGEDGFPSEPKEIPFFDWLQGFVKKEYGDTEELKALKEKNVAKKPIEKVLPYSEEFGFNSEWKCPTCGAYVGYFSEGMSEPEQMEYCNECGQHIAKDWTET